MEKLDNIGWEINNNLRDSKFKFPALANNIETDWLIIGGGLTGLSALNELKNKKVQGKIILVDAGRIGLGSSSRNSGFVVDSTLNNGASTISDIKLYKKKYALNLAGMSELRRTVDNYKINCDWDETGKYHAASQNNQLYKIKNFSKLLTLSGIKHQKIPKEQLSKELGTAYYKLAVKTQGGILLNPSKLLNGLVKNFINGSEIYENTSIDNLDYRNITAKTESGFLIKAKKIVVAVNAELPKLGIKKRYSLPMILTSSITRKLSKSELETIGNPRPWGLLSVKPTGATVRLTNDYRIMIRNTSEPYFNLKNFNLNKRVLIHRQSILKRFPSLDKISFDNSWTGMISISRNGNPVFGNIKGSIFYGGVFNGGGLGISVLFGGAMIDSALGIKSTRLKIVEDYPQANILPPMANLAALLRIKFDRFFGSKEY